MIGSDCFGVRLLLGDAVDVAAAIGHFLGAHAHHLAVGEHGLDLLEAKASFSSPYWGTMTPPLTMRKFI